MLQQYKKIMVAVDGSDEAELAFKKAVNVAIRNNGELLLAHVIDTRSFQNVSSFDSAMVEQVSKDAEKRMKDYQARATKAGAEDVHYSIEFGSPKTIIGHDFPKKHNIDLIVVGATGLNAVERLLIGSVTEYVTRTSKCDVLVCRTEEVKDALQG